MIQWVLKLIILNIKYCIICYFTNNNRTLLFQLHRCARSVEYFDQLNLCRANLLLLMTEVAVKQIYKSVSILIKNLYAFRKEIGPNIFTDAVV